MSLSEPPPASSAVDVEIDDRVPASLAPAVPPLRVATADDLVRGRRERGLSVAWWGVAWMIATEATLFAGLISAWFYVRAAADRWPMGDIEPPGLGRSSIFTVVLLGSSLPMVWAERAVVPGRMRQVRVALALSWLLGAAFLVNQVLEYHDLQFGWRDNTYASLFYVITGLHGLHVLVGLVMGGVVQLKAWLGLVGPRRHTTLQVVALYWHFVDAVWIAVFSSLYLSSHVG